MRSDDTRDKLCQSIIHFEMVYNQTDNRFLPLLQTCNPQYLTTHQTLLDRNTLHKELSTIISDTVLSGTLQNQFKLASSIQIIHNQIQQERIDIHFLKAYIEYVKKLLANPTLDQFTTNLLYVYHNQYLFQGLQGLTQKVNVDTSIDIQNSIDQLDTINNGDNLDLIGLRHRVSPECIQDSDYASLHLPLSNIENPVITGTIQTGIDSNVINALIGVVDSSIQQ